MEKQQEARADGAILRSPFYVYRPETFEGEGNMTNDIHDRLSLALVISVLSSCAERGLRFRLGKLLRLPLNILYRSISSP